MLLFHLMCASVQPFHRVVTVCGSDEVQVRFPTSIFIREKEKTKFLSV